MTQRQRRTNPYSWTWEPAAAVVAALVLLSVGAAQLGRGMANLVAGGGWAWPPSTHLLTSLHRLLGGHPAAGLRPRPDTTASPEALWAWMAATETLAVVAVCALGWAAACRWGPGQLLGVATRAEAEALLGRSRLHATRAVVRPDLYVGPRTAALARSGDHVAALDDCAIGIAGHRRPLLRFRHRWHAPADPTANRFGQGGLGCDKRGPDFSGLRGQQ